VNNRNLQLGNTRFELLLDQARFLGLGKIWIGNRLVRSGRLPLSPVTQSFGGQELADLELAGVEESGGEIRIRLRARFRLLPTKLMRDHSFDPIHETGDWSGDGNGGGGELALVLRPADDCFGGITLSGFSYHYEYSSPDVPLFYLLDRGSWELDGDICGCTAVSQSACSAPVVHFDEHTSWSTEGVIFFGDEAVRENPVMTHNLPRWASHQAFDFHYREGATLIGVFEQVGLIRSVLLREDSKPELKVFDKHLFDQSHSVSTVPKKILLNEAPRSEVAQQNLWTWIIQEVHDRARGEFGLVEEPFLPRISCNYWENFTVDSYYKDLLPAAKAIGAGAVFVDNLHKSAMTDHSPHRDFCWNMCCGHEYEIAPELGGVEKVRQFVGDCRAAGIVVYSWTNNDQALSSPINRSERDQQGWFVKMEDARLKYGGAYTSVFSILDFKNTDARNYWVESLKATRAQTGLSGYLFDSFYNLGFMPVNYSHMRPTTMWRELLQAFKELQENGVHFLIESLGPFGTVQHGCPSTYNFASLFACYKVGLGNDYTTVPTGGTKIVWHGVDAENVYRAFAHLTDCGIPLFWEGERIDNIWGERHRRALADLHACSDHMHRRHLQEDGLSVIWHDRPGAVATIWNFAAREVSLPGEVRDITLGKDLPPASRYALEAWHTYQVKAASLPVVLD